MAESDMLHIPPFLDPVVDFPDQGTSFELLRPLTDFRVCHDVTPAESRIVCTCRQVSKDSNHKSSDELIMKIKVQVREPANSPHPSHPVAGPSITTSEELKAFEILADNPYTPRLIAWKRAVQGDDGPLPGGYLTYIAMTKMPGEMLSGPTFWVTWSPEKREEIVQKFLQALRSIYTLGIEPIDRAFRNILWDEQSKKCIIDFELWRETKETFSDELKELRGWGLRKPAPVATWFQAWKIQEG